MRQGSKGKVLVVSLVGAVILAVGVFMGIRWSDGADAPRTGSRPGSSDGARLLAEIEKYRQGAARMAPEQAVSTWFELFGRASRIGADSQPGDATAFDTLSMAPVGHETMLAALPPPPAWRAFRDEAARRTNSAKASEDLLAVRYLAEVLAGDREAALRTLDRIANEYNRKQIGDGRALLAKLYGDSATRIAEFEAVLARPLEEFEDYEDFEVPDLLTLVGEPRASELLTRAVQGPRTLKVSTGEPMRQLARRVALANVARMKQPQWQLAASVEAADLYEAMSKRFPADTNDDPEPLASWRWREATMYYFLASVGRGQQASAEKALEALSRDQENIRVPREAVEALQRAQLNLPLYRFLDKLLQRRPGIPAWDLYLEQAAFTGNSEAGLARLDSVLAKPDIPPGLRGELTVARFTALLAADRIEQAKSEAAKFLSVPIEPKGNLISRVDVAARAMLAGRLLGNRELAGTGENFARAVILQAPAAERPAVIRAHFALYGELRASGRPDEARQLAQGWLDRKIDSFGEAFSRNLGANIEGERAAVIEIAGMDSAAGRHEAVLELLQSSPYWGVKDLAPALSSVDSQGMPLGVMVARALAAKNDKAAALRVARATVAALPGKDAGYELIATLDEAAIPVFDAMFAIDEFEERPLIWKASLQFDKGAIDDAEATIRAAIAVDPSDGEEGPNDRMRAYAVLSRILERQGDAADARLYAGAVEAIRLSERGDQYHKAGLYDRAFRTYREALEKFSDAYCIQSRLAVQLNKQGRRQEALVHYRRAYELMPASFGRVESHCFGCESVFEGAEAQSLAERVFTDIIRKNPDKPQAYYLLAYLREHQGRHAEALQPLRAAVSLDPRYLNAWKRLDGLARSTYVEAGEHDIARLKLMELDPMQRHVRADFEDVGDLRGLWEAAEKARAVREKAAAPKDGLLRLEASARLLESAEAGTPESMRPWRHMEFQEPLEAGPQSLLFRHQLVRNTMMLMAGDSGDAASY